MRKAININQVIIAFAVIASGLAYVINLSETSLLPLWSNKSEVINLIIICLFCLLLSFIATCSRKIIFSVCVFLFFVASAILGV